MTRLSRINTIWRKELIDTLRDRRTVIAMVLVPMVLYPALMLGSMQAIEVQVSSLQVEEYDVAVADEATQLWLRRIIDSDLARRDASNQRPAEDLVANPPAASQPADESIEPAGPQKPSMQNAKAGVYNLPPPLRVFVHSDPIEAVRRGRVHTAVLVKGPPPGPDSDSSTPVAIAFDEAQIRSVVASEGVRGVLDRANEFMLSRRLGAMQLDPSFIEPLHIRSTNVATAERMAGSVLGQIVPLILIMMTMTGAIYPAIDLTAGERERGTLETLMAAPVPTVDLITGKFVVVTLVGMLSAILNLLSIGGTIYLGGVGSILTQGNSLIFPIYALPWVLAMLLPLAVMFSAVLLAVCSFARSFKEAQNYIVPVMMAAMIPGVVGILPGTRMEGPITIMPVANIVVLTRDLFLGEFDLGNILWVMMSTSLYAVAAVAVAAKLFGQEAVQFADSGSVRTIFQRRYFKPKLVPSAATALLALTIVYILNFYIQNSVGQAFMAPGESPGQAYLGAIMLTLVMLLGVAPYAMSKYLRLNAPTTFMLEMPAPQAWIVALLLGGSTWILARSWAAFQSEWFPMDPAMKAAMEAQLGDLLSSSALPLLLMAFAITPALVEELFFRGFVLSGLASNVGRITAVIVVALAFGLFHYSAHRMFITTALGLVLCLLAIQYRSIWPGMLAHMMHNGLSILAERSDALKPHLESFGFTADVPAPQAWLICAVMATVAALAICVAMPGGAIRTRSASE